ncbi:ATP-binding cassette domain-containing protein [Arenibaculum pallidiluteum]|uniref:ATP-binding cassette domain-containing protein n=1 Tax=Arenibaculum pallidiluteum TaxID=2812559 RepID=UPI001A9597AE|nr:ATP-binding cassette domain-containing protein [Arenibaculum pallidiluteum]
MRASPTILPLRLSGVAYDVGGRRLVEGIDLVLSGPGRVIVLGPNGAGKSLFLRLCHGLLSPTQGKVEWLGPGASLKARRHLLVAQRPVMLRRSVLGDIIHALNLAGLGWTARRTAARAALERFGMTALADRPARILSGGEQQRLALARAWALRPEVLFLDEPTANLDPSATRAVEAMIDAFHAEGTKVVMTTHDLGQARRLADEILFMDRGRLIERAPAGAFFEAPHAPAAAAFLRGDLPW